jgi:hypothetical protein
MNRIGEQEGVVCARNQDKDTPQARKRSHEYSDVAWCAFTSVNVHAHTRVHTTYTHTHTHTDRDYDVHVQARVHTHTRTQHLVHTYV